MADNQQQAGRLKELRIATGLSQEKFAEKIGVAQGQWSRVEGGLRPVSRQLLEKLLAVIPGLNTEWLLKGVGEMTTTGKLSPNSGHLISDPVHLIDALKANEHETPYRSQEEQIKQLRLKINRLEQFISKKFPDFTGDES